MITRKTLGGLETDLSARALGADGEVVPGLYAVGEAAGFSGGACTATGAGGHVPGGSLFSADRGPSGRRSV